MSKWEWKKLKDICEKGSSNIKQSDLKDLTGDYPIFGASGYIQNVDFYQRDRDYIGIIKDGSGVGRTMLLPAFSSVIGTLQYILPKEGNDIKFINYALQNIDFSKSVQGAAIPHIYFKDYGETEILVPPLSEQKSIVKFLDEEFSKIETLKTNAETNLKNAKALYQKSLDKIIEDECRRYTLTSLKEITTKIGSGATPKGGKKSYQTEGISLIRSMNVLYGSFSYDNLAHINEKQAKALDGVAIQCADVLFNITGASIARCCVVPDDVIPARVNQHVSILRPIQKVLNSDYLSVVLLASQNQKKLLDIGEAGATRQALTKGDLEVFQIPLPPLSVQKEIVARLDKLSENVKRLEANYKQIIANCDELKKSILKKTFEGES